MLKIKLIPLGLIFLINISLAIAYDLSDYPDLFMQEGKINITAVVGDKSTSPNVIALTSIYFSLKPRNDIAIQTKLASEIADLKQNIISLGNPCINKITASIMSNPQPCDKDFPKGKAFIKLMDNGAYHYIIVAGYSDAGTRKAADVLANYMDYILKGSEFVIDIDNDQTAAALVGQKEVQKDPEKRVEENTTLDGGFGLNETQKDVQEQNYTQEISEDKNEESSVVPVNEEKNVNNEAEDEANTRNETKGQGEIRIEQKHEEKSNFITRFFRRIINLFRQK